MSASEKWYVAKLIVRCRVGEQDSAPWTVDEQIRVLRAADNELAYVKALRLGRSVEHSYENHSSVHE